MVEKTVQIKLDPGLQARLAAKFVQEATRFSSQINLLKDGRTINAKSIMGLMSLAMAKGEEITLQAEGADEEEALDVLVRFVTNES
ncbi:HPr family phosphocarrier protein [Aciduricibacillus chroicocephali]|uniref:HPr family phosphocarrier protein n=1 Tax=Aciduricibacillus chroicocephali TaxID=3054939 RepID=A0ABY9KTC2_9BACI|nr:HPr family phosphocarrier protein [Bacillaceae bacterium 44XB]